MRVGLRLSLFLFVLIWPLGCGKGAKLAPVSGRVTLNNRPLANAEVRFIPIGDNRLPSSVGSTDDQGNYELHLQSDDTPGAAPGEHRVTISLDLRRDKERSKKIMESTGARMFKKPDETIPAQYNRDSKLTCTVPPEGTNSANFNLKSK